MNDFRWILEKAKKYDACVIADEAYGDYLPGRNSAAALLNEYDNLIVVRTFSKGFGLAGIRAGYLPSWVCFREENQVLTKTSGIPRSNCPPITASWRDQGRLPREGNPGGNEFSI